MFDSIGSYCRPRVHVGLNTCRVAMESVAAQVSSQSSSTISTKTTVGSAAYTGIATHMVSLRMTSDRKRLDDVTDRWTDRQTNK